jgi:drug/metabolite transporter (DMT)-like permease
VLAGVGGALGITCSALLVRLSETSPSTAAVFRCAYAVPLLVVLAAWETRRYGPRPARDRWIGVVAGVLFAADLVLWHHSIVNVGAGLATVLGNMQVLLVAFAAWAILGERPERRVIAALPVVFSGAVMISGVLESGAYGADPALGTVFGLLTTIAYSGLILVLRQVNRDVRRPAGPLLDATAVAAVVAALSGAVVGDVDLVPSWPAHAWLVLLAVSAQVVGWLLISVSLPRLPAALTSVLLLIQPVGAVALAAVVLGEDPSTLQVGGVVVVLVGIGLATLPAPRRAPRAAAPLTQK